MSRPRQELRTWSKNGLINEIQRLEAIVAEHAERLGDDPTKLGGGIIDVAGDPHARGGVIIDTRDAVLLDAVDVAVVDDFHEGRAKHPVLALTLAGRINRTERRSQILYMFDQDGAAGIVSELLALAWRIGPDFADQLSDRLAEAPGFPPTLVRAVRALLKPA